MKIVEAISPFSAVLGMLFIISTTPATAGCFGFCKDSASERLSLLSTNLVRELAVKKWGLEFTKNMQVEERAIRSIDADDNNSKIHFATYLIRYTSNYGDEVLALYVNSIEKASIIDGKISRKPMKITGYRRELQMVGSSDEHKVYDKLDAYISDVHSAKRKDVVNNSLVLVED